MEKSLEKNVKVKVFKFDPSTDKDPHYQTYEVPVKYEGMTVLGLLLYIVENLDPDLTFIYSCSRIGEKGKCGSCDSFINGRGAQTCIYPVKEREFLIEPPAIIGYPVIKDLITSQFSLVDRERFFVPYNNASHRFKKTYKNVKERMHPTR